MGPEGELGIPGYGVSCVFFFFNEFFLMNLTLVL